MGGVPGGGIGDTEWGAVSVSTSETSKASDTVRTDWESYVLKSLGRFYPKRVMFDVQARSDKDSLYLKGSLLFRGFVYDSVVEGYNEYGGAYGVWLYQELSLEGEISFNKATGVPTGITGGSSAVLTNYAEQFGGFMNMRTSYGTQPSYAPNKLFGMWVPQGGVHANVRWPMWQISGSQFRFFGQNWIRLTKVSGP